MYRPDLTSVTEQVAFFSSSIQPSRAVSFVPPSAQTRPAPSRGSHVARVTRLYPKHPTGQDLGHHGLAPPPSPLVIFSPSAPSSTNYVASSPCAKTPHPHCPTHPHPNITLHTHTPISPYKHTHTHTHTHQHHPTPQYHLHTHTNITLHTHTLTSPYTHFPTTTPYTHTHTSPPYNTQAHSSPPYIHTPILHHPTYTHPFFTTLYAHTRFSSP